MRSIVAASVVGVVVADYHCPGGPFVIHAGLRMTSVAAASCDTVKAEMLSRVAGENGWYDQHNRGTYKQQDYGGDLSFSRLTGDGKYTDKMAFVFTDQDGSCKIEGCSEAQVFSIADFSTNYCEQKLLYCGSDEGCNVANSDFSHSEDETKTMAGASTQFSDCLKVEELEAEAKVHYYYDYYVSDYGDASGTIYVVRHAETKNHDHDHGINEQGLQRAANMVKIFDGSKFEKPKTIIAASVTSKVQRMEDTVAPLADHLGLQMQIVGPLEDDDSKWTFKPCADAARAAASNLHKGPVVIAWWSYITYLCKGLGQKCPNSRTDFKGYDEVLVVTVRNGKVHSMEIANEGFSSYANDVNASVVV